MAVVQISRIQHRRGRKNTGTGIPQLASGELGWAIDAQELYIGNGAVSEGAPFVGNTKILTEYDDLLEIAGQYAYKRDIIQTGASAAVPVERTIQEKLDDIVSVRDFGATGDGTDQTVSIQRAIDQLFINSATKGLYISRVTLHFPAGEYLISSPLYIPPFANIAGDGKDKTYIIANGAHAFYTKNETSVPGSYAADNTTTFNNQARQILLKGMTILHTSYGGALRLESCRDSVFEDLSIVGQWTNGSGIGFDYIGIKLNALSTGVSSNNNKFLNCDFTGLIYPVYSDYDTFYNRFENCNFDNCGFGIVFGQTTVIGSVGQLTGPCHNVITNCNFQSIDRNAVIINYGTSNSSVNNRYIAVGNDAGTSATATYSIIKFAERGNVSENDFFERTGDLTIDPINAVFSAVSYPPEIEGFKDYTNNYQIETEVGNALTLTDFMNLPADQDNGKIEVYYNYTANIAVGPVFIDGVWTIIYNKNNSEFSFSDAYTFTGNPTKLGDIVFSGNIVGSRIEIGYTNNTLDNELVEDDLFVFKVRHIA